MADGQAAAVKPPEKKDDEKVPFYKLFSFADKLDILLMVVGTISAIGNGVSQPLMTLIFGELIDSFGGGDRSTVVHAVSKVIDLGFCFFVECSVLGISCSRLSSN